MNEQVFGIFSTADAAEHAIAALKDHGVSTQEISVVHRADGSGAPEVEGVADHGLTSTSSGDVVSGALKGGSAGLLLGVIGGALAITIPGIGLVLAAGPLWAAVSVALATTAAGAVSGGTVGFLVDQGVSEVAATRYHDAVMRGDILVSVHSAHISSADASLLLEKYGAVQIEAHQSNLREVPAYETPENSVFVVAANNSTFASDPAYTAGEVRPAYSADPVLTETQLTGEALNWPVAAPRAGHVDSEVEDLEPVGSGAGV